MKIFRAAAIAFSFLFLSGCATTTPANTRPPQFTEAVDSKEGLVLIHDGLPGDSLILDAEGSNWKFSHPVPTAGESWVSAGTAPRVKVIRNQIAFIQNPDWGVIHKFWDASEVTTGNSEVAIGTVTLEGKSRPLRIRIVPPRGTLTTNQ